MRFVWCSPPCSCKAGLPTSCRFFLETDRGALIRGLVQGSQQDYREEHKLPEDEFLNFFNRTVSDEPA